MIQNHVTSLELSKKLHKLLTEKGIKVESNFYWIKGEMEYGYEGDWNIIETETEKWFLFDHIVGCKFGDYDFKPINDCDIGNTDEEYIEWEKKHKKGLERMRQGIIPAFLASELGEIFLNHPDYNYQTYKNLEKGFYIGNYTNEFGFYADTEPEARGLMLCFLLENNLM